MNLFGNNTFHDIKVCPFNQHWRSGHTTISSVKYGYVLISSGDHSNPGHLIMYKERYNNYALNNKIWNSSNTLNNRKNMPLYHSGTEMFALNIT